MIGLAMVTMAPATTQWSVDLALKPRLITAEVAKAVEQVASGGAALLDADPASNDNEAEASPTPTPTPKGAVIETSTPQPGEVTPSATGTAAPTSTASPAEIPIPKECDGMTFDKRVIGTSGADEIRAGDGRQLIFGLGGNDVIYGSSVEDCIVGGDGNDEIHGLSGADVLLGGDGNDTIFGVERNDVDSDYIDGGAGDDIIHSRDRGVDGPDSGDTLVGGPGKDKIFGSDGADEIDGGAADDTIYAGGGKDDVFGGAGRDACDGGSGADTVDCETGAGPQQLEVELDLLAPAVELKWQESAGATSYKIRRSTAAGGPYEIIGTSPNPTYTDAGIKRGIKYYYVVTALYDDALESELSNEATAFVEIPATPTPTATPEPPTPEPDTPTPEPSTPTATPEPPTPEPDTPTPEPTPSDTPTPPGDTP